MRGSLQRHLTGWAVAALAVVWAGFIAIGFGTGEHEADELTDGHLASVASLLLGQREIRFAVHGAPSPRGWSELPEMRSHDYQQSLSVVLWDAGGRVLARTGGSPLPPFDAQEGFETLSLGDPPQHWRTFSRWDSPQRQRKLMVLLSIDERDALARDIAEQIARPGLWMLPVVALAVGLAIRRGLRPLRALSQEVRTLDIHRSPALHASQRHLEFESMVEAVNLLVERYQAALARERQLASELAHELRTPLASIALHARGLRDENTTAREATLQRIERDALRAGDVLTELLALARADRTEMSEAARPLDLAELARRVAGEFAQRALDTAHDLAVTGASRLPCVGHDLLLQIALRNLIENALAHTPRGTRVEVQLDAESGWMQVCDDGAGGSARSGEVPAAADVLGLGLGHRVVDKIAAIHHGRFEAVEPPPGYSTCYRITLAAARSAPAENTATTAIGRYAVPGQ
ncbi:two-component sensor histidine kinase [Schlegelella sp. S2-27]|uniref:histidine kinase n=1 Tax=Caldimonas mangrovi TaxID=2944811 RepID=A0ABT0YR47_9BURK|nr:histidine kinase dimerization/phospho-acceptor domain-containing protein [Caldimonas mangrovi]MCM5681207.1 two-component sensor histidine kinase [Caldimonas mangrovi]